MARLVHAQPDARSPERVLVPAASFYMGSEEGAADEQPVRVVALKAFALDRYEVTNGRYADCVAAGQCRAPQLMSSRSRDHYYDDPRYADFPVVLVDHAQAAAFCAFAAGRLPTEAEWERAARGALPSLNIFPWGDAWPTCALANFAGCLGDTDRVGARPAGQSPVGAVDMAGNVWEWVSDWYDVDYYREAPATDPVGPNAGTLRVMRGGCWQSGVSSLRVSCRKAELPQAWADNVGFRCAYDVGGAP